MPEPGAVVFIPTPEFVQGTILGDEHAEDVVL
jgi:hypothetical protein